MPIVVDHQARKDFVISVTADLIASEGLEATTIRTVAKAAGYSTSIITHYFEDKLQLLRQTYVTIAARRRARLEKMTGLEEGDTLLECAMALLPLGPDSRRDWLVYCAFLASGIAHRELSQLQAYWADQTVGVFARLLAQHAGQSHEEGDRIDDARALVSLLTGLSVMNLLDPAGYSEEQLVRMVRKEITRIRRPG